MKTLLLLLAVAASVWGQTTQPTARKCQCSAFVTLPEGEINVLDLPPLDLGACEDEIACSTLCEDEWTFLTNNGDLDYLMGNTTVGQHMCDNLVQIGHNNIDPPEDVHLYYNLCDGPWIYNGVTSIEELCCQYGTHVTCPLPSEATLVFPLGQTTETPYVECLCSAFVILPEGMINVLDFPNNNVTSCAGTPACGALCADEWTLNTNNGDLDHPMTDGITVGQHMCENLAQTGYNSTYLPEDVYLYYNLCDGPWIFDGMPTNEELCCQDGVYVPCLEP